jgi:hypothetical protein
MLSTSRGHIRVPLETLVQELVMVARELPGFVAELDLLPTEAGGRQTALTGGEWRTIWRVDV